LQRQAAGQCRQPHRHAVHEEDFSSRPDLSIPVFDLPRGDRDFLAPPRHPPPPALKRSQRIRLRIALRIADRLISPARSTSPPFASATVPRRPVGEDSARPGRFFCVASMAERNAAGPRHHPVRSMTSEVTPIFRIVFRDFHRLPPAVRPLPKYATFGPPRDQREDGFPARFADLLHLQRSSPRRTADGERRGPPQAKPSVKLHRGCAALPVGRHDHFPYRVAEGIRPTRRVSRNCPGAGEDRSLVAHTYAADVSPSSRRRPSHRTRSPPSVPALPRRRDNPIRYPIASPVHVPPRGGANDVASMAMSLPSPTARRCDVPAARAFVREVLASDRVGEASPLRGDDLAHLVRVGTG